MKNGTQFLIGKYFLFCFSKRTVHLGPLTLALNAVARKVKFAVLSNNVQSTDQKIVIIRRKWGALQETALVVVIMSRHRHQQRQQQDSLAHLVVIRSRNLDNVVQNVSKVLEFIIYLFFQDFNTRRN